MKPLVRCLDLFCCEGGAGMGYHRAGMEVTGVDIEPQPRYPFTFAQADALEFLREFGHEFDFIHASPPCQHFTKYKNCRPDIPTRYEDLIEPTRKALMASGKPWVMENVVGAPLRNPIVLCGSMFGLDVRRHRLFEASFELPQMECNHALWEPNRFPGGRSRERGHARVKCRGTVEVGRWNIPMDTQRAAMGIDWIADVRKLSEAIPPAYTEWIGREFLKANTAVCGPKPSAGLGTQDGLVG